MCGYWIISYTSTRSTPDLNVVQRADSLSIYKTDILTSKFHIEAIKHNHWLERPVRSAKGLIDQEKHIGNIYV